MTPRAAPARIQLTKTEYRAHCRDYDGVCLACKEWSAGGVEPDVSEYECESCGESQVMGCEEALVLGHLEIIE